MCRACARCRLAPAFCRVRRIVTPNSVNLGPKSARVWPSFGQLWGPRANVGQRMRAKLGSVWPDGVVRLPILASLGPTSPIRANPGQCWPKWTDMWQRLTKFDQLWPNLSRVWLTLDQIWGGSRPNSDNIGKAEVDRPPARERHVSITRAARELRRLGAER